MSEAFMPWGAGSIEILCDRGGTKTLKGTNAANNAAV